MVPSTGNAGVGDDGDVHSDSSSWASENYSRGDADPLSHLHDADDGLEDQGYSSILEGWNVWEGPCLCDAKRRGLGCSSARCVNDDVYGSDYIGLAAGIEKEDVPPPLESTKECGCSPCGRRAYCRSLMGNTHRFRPLGLISNYPSSRRRGR